MARTYSLASATRLLARLGAGLGIVSLLGGSSLLAMAEEAQAAADAAVPSDVENLQGFPGDGEATLTWDAATDDTGVEGYYVYAGLESVEANGGSYTFGSTDASDSTTYIMDNLTNGVTYYFTVTAYDADGNESQYYSKEVEVTPEASELGDFTAPTVKNASASTSTLVEVEFSEAVELPTDSTSAFALESTSGTAIEVLDAYVSSDAPSTVFVVTAEQTAGTQYILTAGIGITDLAGNTIESGTSDTAIFTGSSLQKTDGDTTTTDGSTSSDTFMVDEVEATDVNELVLTFTQPVVSADPGSFTIQAADDATQIVDVLAVSIDDQDSSLVTLTTEDMESGFDYVLTMDEMIFNTDGDSLAEENMSVEFTAKTKDLADLVAPEDITNFLAAVSEETSVLLSWTASEDTAGDLAKYLVYQSLDGGLTFGDALSVASDAVDYEVTDLTAGETYTFKVTAVDENGNESEGVLTTVTLPEAGPELLVLGALSFFGAGAWTRKKKRL